MAHSEQNATGIPEVEQGGSDAARWNEEGDEMVRALFSPADLQMSPEEYAARQAHNWACFSFHRYRYRDPVLGAWIRRLGEILFSEDEHEIERYRQQYLTPEEIARVHRQEEEDF